MEKTQASPTKIKQYKLRKCQANVLGIFAKFLILDTIITVVSSVKYLAYNTNRFSLFTRFLSMKLAKYLIIFSLLSFSTVLAGSMKFFPSTWDMGMYCRNIWNVAVNTDSRSINAIDSRILSHDIMFNGSLPTLSFGAYGSLWSGGSTLKAMNSYAKWFSYMYTNRYANNSAWLLNTWHTILYSFLFSNTWSQLTWLMDLYFFSWENTDDSNMQSGIVNGMRDILDEVNSGFYNFWPMPCVMDIHPPLFNGFTSGASYDPNITTWFSFTVYEYTWVHLVNYRFQSGSSTTGNLSNYVYVPLGSGIDNQNGVNSGTISVYLSWITLISGSNLLAPTTLTNLNCSLAYAWPWYPLTWNRHTRWYTCFLPFSSLSLQADQIVQVTISWADNANFYGAIHTGSTSFTLRLSAAIFVPPPLIPAIWWGGWGWPGLRIDNCSSTSWLPWVTSQGTDGSASYYDGTCESAVHESAPLCPVEESSYSQELVDAFQEGYALWLTNKCPIENAKLKEPLKRKDLSKLLVWFSINVLGVMPNTNKADCDQYADMKNSSDEMKFYAKIGCQLEVMWMQPDGITPMKNFYPDQIVTRAQFGTTLSRLIFGRRFNAEKPYRYSWHLDVLKQFNIIKVIVPTLEENKWFVLLMLSRTRASWLVEQFRLAASAKNGAVALK